jgi:hypothetical protein
VHAAPTAQQTVKDVALIFGQALVRNDGGTAVAMLSPALRSHTAPNQLPAMLGVYSPPLNAKVIRWTFSGDDGNATISMGYAKGPVAERLYMHLYAEGWRIIRIMPEDAVTLQRAAETTVTAFCDAALRRDLEGMRQQLTDKYGAKLRTSAALLQLIPLQGAIAGYSVASFGGTPAGADVYVQVHTDTASVRLHFVVINDRDGWRISSIIPA